MNKPIEGEPAFPNGPHGGSIHYDDGHIEHQYPGSPGLSERRYYIAAALQGFCTNTSLMVDASYEATAAMAIQQADAVMALLHPAEASEPESEPDEPETSQAAEPPPDHRQLKVGELKRPGDLVRLLDGSFTTIDGYGEDGKLVQEGEIRFRRNKFERGDRVVYTPLASAFATENDVWYVVGVAAFGDYRISRQSIPEGDGKTARAEDLAPIDRECPF